jgi:hypothetical protein
MVDQCIAQVSRKAFQMVLGYRHKVDQRNMYQMNHQSLLEPIYNSFTLLVSNRLIIFKVWQEVDFLLSVLQGEKIFNVTLRKNTASESSS